MESNSLNYKAISYHYKYSEKQKKMSLMRWSCAYREKE